MPYLNIPNSNLVPSVGKITGKLEGTIITGVNSNINTIREEFKKGIPEDPSTYLSRLDNNSEQVSKVKQRLQKFKNLGPTLRRSAVGLNRTVTVLKSLPIPGLNLTGGITTTFSDTLRTVKEVQTQLEEDADGIDVIITDDNSTEIIQDTETSINNLKILLQLAQAYNIVSNNVTTVDRTVLENQFFIGSTKSNISSEIKKIQDILQKYTTLPELNFIEFDQPDQTTEQLFTSRDGRQFSLKIVEIETTESGVFLRQAVAIDITTSTIVTESESTFSPDNSLLFDELKFKINNEL